MLRPELTCSLANPIKADVRKKIPGQVDRSDYNHSNFIVRDIEETKDIARLD